MGCGTSKSAETIENNANSVQQNGKLIHKESIKQINGKANGGPNNGTSDHRMSSRPMTAVPKPVAFDIPLDDKPTANGTNAESESVTLVFETNAPKKLPPKRLLNKLAEQSTNQLTAEQLREKQLKAEEKRLGILGERKLKAHKYNEKFMSHINHNETKSNKSQDLSDEITQNGENNDEIHINNNNIHTK